MNPIYHSATSGDFEQLVELRIDAMKESLMAIGRFNRERSVERYKSTFRPEETKIIKNENDTIGFIAVSEKEDHLYLDHLYIAPSFQSSGVGSWAIKRLIDISERKKIPIRLGALKTSKSNKFYQRHGFEITHEDEFDIYYERKTLSEQDASPNR